MIFVCSIQECRTDIDGKSPVFHALEQQADQLVRSHNKSSNQIDEIIQKVSHQREDIERYVLFVVAFFLFVTYTV